MTALCLGGNNTTCPAICLCASQCMWADTQTKVFDSWPCMAGQSSGRAPVFPLPFLGWFALELSFHRTIWILCNPTPRRAPKWDTSNTTPRTQSKGDKAQNPVEAARLLPHSGRREGTRTATHCPSDTHNHGTELAMKVVRQARLELSGGSTPDLLRPPLFKTRNPMGTGTVFLLYCAR